MPIYFIYIFHDPGKVNSNRKGKSGEVTAVPCPRVVKEYTAALGGCNLTDQMTNLYRSHRHYRWPQCLMIKCLLWCCFNAYIIEGHIRPHTPPGDRSRTFYDFLDEICMTLVDDFQTRAGQRIVQCRRLQRQGCKMQLCLCNILKDHLRQLPTRRVVYREKVNKYLSAHPGTALKEVPFKKSKTVFCCTQCKEYLCIHESSTCWIDYHSKVQYWR